MQLTPTVDRRILTQASKESMVERQNEQFNNFSYAGEEAFLHNSPFMSRLGSDTQSTVEVYTRASYVNEADAKEIQKEIKA